jgi:UDP-N-acetylglucosamine 1-carboxyvinyltransferase
VDKIIIQGGVALKGNVSISGAKNAVLPILLASILTEGENYYTNIPRLRDINTIQKLLSMIGVEVKLEDSAARVNATHLFDHQAPYELVRTMRASVLVLGPLLARMGKARVSMPGGCAIGTRPIDLHLKGLEALGAQISLHQGYIEAKAKCLRGADIYFDRSTVTGTENIMMAATMAKGTTLLRNAAYEPEVVDLAEVLTKMGARISGAGTDVITIEGVRELCPVQHRVIPDRIEAGTFMAALAITGGDICIQNCRMEHLGAVTTKLKEAGVQILNAPQGCRVIAEQRTKAVDIKTHPYPGFPTDMQAQMMALMSVSEGTSLITETVFENRFMHVSELKRLGADIEIEGSLAAVKGVKRLFGAPVMATDLRASASLILAGLAAEGTTEVSRVYHLDRGYERIERKLAPLGARIERVRE